jgi:succinoglycan biosynthesis transport protein ExoP
LSTSYPPTEFKGAGNRQLSLRDLLVVLFRRRWIVLGISLPIIVFGIYGTLTSSDSFTASSQVMIEPRSVNSPTFRLMSVDMDVFMNTASQVAQSIPVATRAAAALVDSLPVLSEKDHLLEGLQSEGDLRDLILMRINAGQVGESNILSINFSHRNPHLALLVVGAMTDAFINYNVESQQNTSAIDYYSEQIGRVHAEIDSLMSERVGVYAQSGLSGFRTNNSAGIQQMRHLEYTYFQTRARREGMENRYEGNIEAISLNSDYMPNMKSGENPNLVKAKGALADAILDLAKLRIQHPDSSRFVMRQAEYMEEIRIKFIQERESFVRDMHIALESLRREEQSELTSLNAYKVDILSYPQWEQQIHALEMRVNTKKDLLESLQLKLGEVRLKGESDQRISNITALNVPTIGMAVGGSKKIIYLLLAGILGLVLGLVAALLVDAQDHRIFDRRQAEHVLEVPVLGSISPKERTSGKL